MNKQMKIYQSTPKPPRSPWGAVQTATEWAPGIWSVSTAGHGGFKLSRERNADMPAYMRRAGGWYEEDCEWSLVGVAFAGVFSVRMDWQKPTDPTSHEIAERTMRDCYPDAYEQFFGVVLTPEESLVLRERKFAIDHANDYVVIAAWGDWAKFVPAGKVGVVATLGGRRDADTPEKWFLIDDAEYAGNFVIDLGRHQEIAAPPEGDRASR